MTNEKFKLLASQIFETVEDEEFFICKLEGYDVIFLDLNGNMYREFVYYYINQNILKTLWELRILGMDALRQGLKEYFAIQKLMISLI